MSLMGVDVGTSGVKAVTFSADGDKLAAAYEEYPLLRPQPGWAELDSEDVWSKTKRVIRSCAAATSEAVQAISFSSMGEAVVPVTAKRRILGPSIVPNFDKRGQEYLPKLGVEMDQARLYEINGNIFGNNYSLTALKWVKEQQPELYRATDYFLLWGACIPFMLGGEPHTDYSLANRTLLFDLEREDWSDELLAWAGLERGKLPPTVPPGTPVGGIATHIAAELGLQPGIPLFAGAHDQAVNELGCGVIDTGLATYGMGTFFVIGLAWQSRPEPQPLFELGLNTEHHAMADRYIAYLYNLGGALIRWYRDTFATYEHQAALESGRDVYPDLFAEMPAEPSSVLALPHFAPTGPPEFITDSRGVLMGLQLETGRGDILKGIVEGVSYYLKEAAEALPALGISTSEYRATGGGAKSDTWLQLLADIMGKPVGRPAETEATALGAAMLAGIGHGWLASGIEGVERMVRIERTFEPSMRRHRLYQARYEKYKELWPLLKDYLHELSKDP